MTDPQERRPVGRPSKDGRLIKVRFTPEREAAVKDYAAASDVDFSTAAGQLIDAGLVDGRDSLWSR